MAVDPVAVSRLCEEAAKLYSTSSLFDRTIMRNRPRICPFDRVIEAIPQGSRVLDLGCGRGLLLGLLATAGRIESGEGLDLNVAALDQARLMANTHGLPIVFATGSAAAPEPSAGAYDVVSMVDILHHIAPRSQEDAIRAALRFVKPGGLLVYKDMAQRPLHLNLANRGLDLVMSRQWIHYFPARSVESIAGFHGFTLTASEDIRRAGVFGHELRVFRRA